MKIGHVVGVLYNMFQIHQPHDHDSDEMKRKVKELRTNLKQRIEDSAQTLKRIYIIMYHK